MRTVIAIALKDIRLRLRDRSAIAQSVVAPLTLAVIMTVAFTGYDANGRSQETLDLAFANQDAGRFGAEIEAAFGEPPLRFIRLHKVSSAADARALLIRGGASSAIVVPSDFTRRASAGNPRLDVIDGPGKTIENAVAAAVGKALLAQVEAIRISVLVASELGPGTNIDALIDAAAKERIPIDLTDVASAGGSRGPAAYFGPSMAIMALFFTVALAGKSLWFERRAGLLRRLESTDTTLRQIVIAKAVAASTIAFTGTLVMWATTTVVFSTSWGNPLLVALLLTGVVFSSLGVTIFVTGVATSEERLDVIAALLGAVLALVGGNLIPYHRLPAAMAGISKFTPNAWALRGFVDVGAGASALSSILPSLLALATFGVLFGGFGIVRLQRVLNR